MSITIENDENTLEKWTILQIMRYYPKNYASLQKVGSEVCCDCFSRKEKEYLEKRKMMTLGNTCEGVQKRFEKLSDLLKKLAAKVENMFI